MRKTEVQGSKLVFQPVTMNKLQKQDLRAMEPYDNMGSLIQNAISYYKMDGLKEPSGKSF